jgi:hypothetical protein
VRGKKEEKTMNQPCYKSLLPLDLQLFAGEGGAGAGSGASGAGEGGTGSGTGQGGEGGAGAGSATGTELPKTLEELQKLIQSEGDKRVTGALKTAQEKWEADFKTKLELEKAEAQKLAGLSAADKEKALLEKSKKDIEDRERAIAQKELKLETINILNEKKLPITLADFLLADDAEKTKSNVDTFEKAFREAIEAGVNERLKGNPLKVGTGGGNADNYGKKVAEASSKRNVELEKARQSYFN